MEEAKQAKGRRRFVLVPLSKWSDDRDERMRNISYTTGETCDLLSDVREDGFCKLIELCLADALHPIWIEGHPHFEQIVVDRLVDTMGGPS